MYPALITKLLSTKARNGGDSYEKRHHYHSEHGSRNRSDHHDESAGDREAVAEILVGLRDELRRLNQTLEETDTTTPRAQATEIPVTTESSDTDETTEAPDNTASTESDVAALARAVEQLQADVATLEDQITEQN